MLCELNAVKVSFENSQVYIYAYFCRRKGTSCMKDGKSKTYHEKRHLNSTDRSEIVEKLVSGGA